MKKRIKQVLASMTIVVCYIIAAIVVAIRCRASMFSVEAHLIEFFHLRGELCDMVYYAALFCVVFTALFLQTLIHEGGHLLFGLATGYRFSSFRVGNLMLKKDDTGFSFKRYAVMGTGGQCLMIPPAWQENGIPYRLMNLGGGLLNLLAVIPLWWLGSLFRDTAVLHLLFTYASVFGVALAIINLVPFSGITISNDGANIKRMKNNIQHQKQLWIRLHIADEYNRGKRLHQMPENWFCLPEGDSWSSESDIQAVNVYCAWLMDQHRFEEAAYLLGRVDPQEGSVSKLTTMSVDMELFSCRILSGVHPQDVDDELLMKAKRAAGRRKEIGAIRTRYIIAAIMERNEKSTRAALKEMQRLLKRYPYDGDAQLEQELVEIAQRYSEIYDAEIRRIEAQSTEISQVNR